MAKPRAASGRSYAGMAEESKAPKPKPKGRKPGDVRDRSRVTKGTTPPVTVAQVKKDNTLSVTAKEIIIKAIQAKRGQGGGK